MRNHSIPDVNIAAMEQMNTLHDLLKSYGYTDKEREVFLVRLLLCYFAEDTGVFSGCSWYDYLTMPLPGDPEPAVRFAMLRSVLSGEAGQKIPEVLSAFPVLGKGMFAEDLPLRPINAFFVPAVLAGKGIRWRDLTPAIFGALFQEITDQRDRREWGAYYTSEENIDRVIDPLFFDDLRGEWESCRGNRRRMKAFHEKLSQLTFLDPACGCGNFLIRIYQRLRLLEMSVIEELYDIEQRVLDISLYCHVSVNQFFGIELSSFQANIARAGMWLAQRQMDLLAAERFGMGWVMPAGIRSIGVRTANALLLDWAEVVSRETISYIVGNPPFVGARLMNASQKSDMKAVFGSFRAVGNLDYVTAWYRKAAEFMMGTSVRAAFVSTNSISQGEQASLLWDHLANAWHMRIDFAWRTFIWNNECREQARVHCVIIGFTDADNLRRGGQYEAGCRLYEGEQMRLVPHINGYLTAAEDIVIRARRTPVCGVSPMQFGSMANDGGHLILTEEERTELVRKHPSLRPYIRPFLGAVEFIHGKNRYCLWFPENVPEEILKLPEVADRIRRVRRYREESSRADTRKLALTPHLFGEIRQPEAGHMILVPRVSSVRREVIPMGFVESRFIASDAMLMIPYASEALFALLNSQIHMLWMRNIAGRLKSDYRYSASIVYNNFPFPTLTEDQEKQLAEAAEEILRARRRYAGSSLAYLYDPDTMPDLLRKAHRSLNVLAEEIFGCRGMREEQKLAMLFTKVRDMTGG